MSRQPEQSGSIPRAFTPPAERVKLWKKILIGRRQHWVVRALQATDDERRRLLDSPNAGFLSPHWLAPYRAQFRAIAAARAAAAIHIYLLDCPPAMRPLGVWLLGQCGDRLRLYDLAEFCDDPSPTVRRHTARALRRLEAWSRLDAMAADNPDDARIQWYARAPRIKRPYRDRLRDFTRLLDSSHAAEVATPSRMPLWFRDLDWIRRPPKSVAYIRQMLLHIHRLVRGGPQ